MQVRQDILHATCVALGNRAVLVTGAAGRGKSTLALQLMALGCVLVADDRVIVQAEGTSLVARCPPAIAGLIEARGAGILRAASRAQACVVLVVDLDQAATSRLPENTLTRICGCDIPLLLHVAGPHFPAIVLQILKSGWSRR